MPAMFWQARKLVLQWPGMVGERCGFLLLSLEIRGKADSAPIQALKTAEAARSRRMLRSRFMLLLREERGADGETDLARHEGPARPSDFARRNGKRSDADDRASVPARNAAQRVLATP